MPTFYLINSEANENVWITCYENIENRQELGLSKFMSFFHHITTQ